jgi:hypothetical protein
MTEPVQCAWCEAMFPKSDIFTCESCGDYMCPACFKEEIRTWRGMTICELCKIMMTEDIGPDPDDFNEDDWRKDR